MAGQNKGKNNLNIITWNCEGLHSKEEQLSGSLIPLFNPVAILLQDTRLTKERQADYKFEGYTPYFKSIDSRASGVAIFVKNSIPQSEIEITTNLQAVAVRTTINGKKYVLTSVYVPPSTKPSLKDFDHFISKLGSSYILNGDFNAHSPLWKSNRICHLGKIIEKLMETRHIIPLNTTVNTFWSRAHNTFSLIDLTLAHPNIAMDFKVKVLGDLHTSDHYPIVLSLVRDENDFERRPQFNFKKADWGKLIKQCKEEINRDKYINNEDMEDFSDHLLGISMNHIPEATNFPKKFSKGWFDDECKEAKKERARAGRLNQKYRDLPSSIRVKKLQAATRRLFRKKKKECFRNYVSSLRGKVKCKKIWSMIKKITGKNIPDPLKHIKNQDGNLLTNKKEIADEFGRTFEENSSSQQYSDTFKPIKEKSEETPINFNTDKKLNYNRPFKLRDLKRAIKRAKLTASGPDQIHYAILKHLPDETLLVLLDMINKIWTTHEFPPSWRKALVLPVPKPEKDHSIPSNYRPIALTSCLCKTMERMVNERLIYHLEKSKILTKFQCGFRNDKSTLDQLIRLDTYVRDAFINKEHVAAVFFDLHKAYDTTWKHGILRDLYDMGLRGNLPIFIQNFLSDRIFMVIYGATFSDTFNQEEGVPQGAILSTTLFNIKLNDIVKQLCPGVQCSLYVDDFVLYFKSKRTCHLERKLQECIDNVKDWAVANGFTLSEDKTKAMHFCRRQCCADPVLLLNDTPIKFKTEVKFLGLRWDPKLSFKAHIDHLKKKCQSPLNVLRVLSHSDWGSSSKILLRLYRMLIRSKLDYGAIVYRNASKTTLKPLETIHHDALRLCLGAFKSSPVESLYVEANELPLHERRLEQLMRYGLRIKGNPQNPAYNSVFNLDLKNKYNAPVQNPRRQSTRPRRRARSIAVDLEELYHDAQIDLSNVKSNFIPSFPTCYSRNIPVDFELCKFDKNSTGEEVFKTEFRRVVNIKYKRHIHFYTDGSKKEDQASYGVFSEFGVSSARILDGSSIFTAEIEAIKRALKHIAISPRQGGWFVIFSDSKSVLESIQEQDSRNPLVKEAVDSVQTILRTGKLVEFCWVPSHRGIAGNEKADAAANRARLRDVNVHYRIPYTDYYPKVSEYIHQRWQARWRRADLERPIKLFSIQPYIKPFFSDRLTRREETVIHRIRIGHTWLTHSYLMEGLRSAPACHYCSTGSAISIRHLMITCPGLKPVRDQFYASSSMRKLFEDVPLETIIKFLRESELFLQI